LRFHSRLALDTGVHDAAASLNGPSLLGSPFPLQDKNRPQPSFRKNTLHRRKSSRFDPIHRRKSAGRTSSRQSSLTKRATRRQSGSHAFQRRDSAGFSSIQPYYDHKALADTVTPDDYVISLFPGDALQLPVASAKQGPHPPVASTSQVHRYFGYPHVSQSSRLPLNASVDSSSNAESSETSRTASSSAAPHPSFSLLDHSLQPAPVIPETAATAGNAKRDLSHLFSSLCKVQDKRTLAAELSRTDVRASKGGHLRMSRYH